MTHLARQRMAGLLGALATLVACGDRTATDESTPMPMPPDLGPVAESEGDSEGDVVCGDGLAACDGACVELSADDAHCGACNHECKEPWFFGHCLESSCPPTYWCGAIEQGLTTCNDVCALHGQECLDEVQVEHQMCGGSYHLYFYHDALEQCELRVGDRHFVDDITCETPIDWSIEGGLDGSTPGAVACCCTQNPPS